MKDQIQLVRQLKDFESICNNEEFNSLPIPHLPVDELKDVLQVTLEGIEKSAERRVLDHMHQYDSPNMEDWLDAGTDIFDSNAESCPFCGQRLKAGHLIEHYQSYFNKVYKSLKSRISGFSKEYLDFDEQLAGLNRKLQNNSNLLPTWKKELPDISLIPLEYQQISARLKAASDHIDMVMRKKKNAPMEKFELDQKSNEAIAKWKETAARMKDYNRTIAETNKDILSLKQRLQTSNLVKAERKEQDLQNAKCRHDNPLVIDLCREFIAETREVEAEKKKVKETRVAKNQAITSLFEANMDKINKYLGPEYFDVEFQLCQFDFTRDTAGERVNAYAIKFPAGIIPIGKSDAVPSETSFKNALSAGDRGTLSLAIFLAHLDGIGELERKAIVIDDPITSLDANRRWATYEAICELCKRRGQVIVMSHSAEFLHIIWKEYGRRCGRDRTTRRLRIRPQVCAVRASEIEEGWDSDELLLKEQRKRIRLVDEFANGTRHDLDKIGKCLRQIIEHHYKDLYPLQFTSKMGSLGSFIGCVAKAQNGDALKPLKHRKLDELQKANTFLRGLHHGR